MHGGREWGRASLHIAHDHPLFRGLAPVEPVFMSHYDSVVRVGEGFEELGYTVLGESEGGGHRYAAIGSDRLRRYGFQFHPEVDDTVHGHEMIANFVLGICGCTPSWTMERYLEEQVERVRAEVGEGSVFLLASGGVDSTVAAKLFALAIGPDRLHLLHVDNGLMRKGESRAVLDTLRALGLGSHIHFVDASDVFLQALAGAVEPERKRQIIGDTFVEVFEREARRLGIEGHLLGQGTIYPDTIETGGTKRADTIKTHHNRVPVIERMIEAGRVVEPLSQLYKVEVRELGEQLGIPHDMIWRHPFPGPGLGVRLLCSAGVEDRENFGQIEPMVSALAAEYGLQALVLPIRSVGVKADLRAYEHPVMLGGAVGWDRIARSGGHDPEAGARSEPLHLEPGAEDAGQGPPGGRGHGARAAGPAARGGRHRDGRFETARPLRHGLAVPHGPRAARTRWRRPRAGDREADSLRARDDGAARGAARRAARRAAIGDPRPAGRRRPRARRHVEAPGHH